MGAGHGGSSGRYDALRETAFTYAFMLWQMGLTERRPARTEGRVVSRRGFGLRLGRPEGPPRQATPVQAGDSI